MLFDVTTGIFSLISLFFATIAGTKAIENHRTSNVSMHQICQVAIHSILTLTVANFHGGAYPYNERLVRTEPATRENRTITLATKNQVPIFDKSIDWAMPIVPRVDEPSKGVVCDTT